jgi:hypothetical protein
LRVGGVGRLAGCRCWHDGAPFGFNIEPGMAELGGRFRKSKEVLGIELGIEVTDKKQGMALLYFSLAALAAHRQSEGRGIAGSGDLDR